MVPINKKKMLCSKKLLVFCSFKSLVHLFIHMLILLSTFAT